MMGASNSHDYTPASQSTPPKPEKESRVLTVDPRSPTQEITRTPIVVDKTPENTLEGLDDPRSPTVGIARTPLTHAPLPKTEPITEKPVPKIDLELDLSDTSPGSPEDFHGPLLNPFSLSDIQNLSIHDLPISESTRLMPDEKEDKQSQAETEKPKKKKKPRAAQPKELFPSKKMAAPKDVKMAAPKDVTRSPLSTRNVDVNSPRKIVQRKQIKDIDLKRTCALQESSSSVSRFIVKDKENM